VTGSRGFVGGRVSKLLQANNVKVVKTTRKNFKGFKFINWNSTKHLEKLCKNKDIIINCAGLDVHQSKNKKNANKVNAEYPYKLYKAANKCNVDLFIFLSTYHVYDLEKNGKIDENEKLKTKDNYSASKILGEKKLISLKNKKTKLLIIRPCNLFGYPIYKTNNCWKLIINSILKKVTLNKEYIINSKKNNYRNYSSVKNFCLFLLNLIRKIKKIKFKNNTFIINYTSNKNLNLIDLVKVIRKKIKNKNNIIFKHKKLEKAKPIKYVSKYLGKIYSSHDRHFNEEIKNTIKYIKKNFK